MTTSTTLQFITQNVWEAITNLIFPLIVGFVLWKVGNYSEKRKLKANAIQDLMTYRGDYTSPDFRRSLNKVSIIFHDKKNIRSEVRQLYEVMNDPHNSAEKLKRTIVGLIHKLCQENNFEGLTEYDIDQAFAETRQTPEDTEPTQPIPSQPTSTIDQKN